MNFEIRENKEKYDVYSDESGRMKYIGLCAATIESAKFACRQYETQAKARGIVIKYNPVKERNIQKIKELAVGISSILICCVVVYFVMPIALFLIKCL
mgnify:CR=1 FL=1